MRLVQLCQRFETRFVRLTICKLVLVTCEQIGHCTWASAINHRSLMHDRQEATAEVAALVIRQATRIGKHHERRKVIPQAADCIRNPCTHTWEARQDEAGVHHVRCRSVNVGLTGHRHKECHFIHELCLLRELITYPAPRLAILLKCKWTLETQSRLIWRTLRTDMRRELLAVVLDERWLVVIEVHRACATIHEQLDDPLYLWRMVLNTK